MSDAARRIDPEAEAANLPAQLSERADATLAPMFNAMVPSMRMLLDRNFFETAKEIARLMSADTSGSIPKHLRGKPAACFNIVSQAFDWNLGWQYVARHTYETPGGSVGYMGALVHAILERSGRFIGAPKFRYIGDWGRVTGKFTMRAGRNDKEFPVKAWTREDAEGLGIIVSWQIKGEDEPRYWPDADFPFYLTQVATMNSPLWATDPRTQIRYLAIRRFASQVAPSIMGSLPFDVDDYVDASDKARDVTPVTGPAPPRPTRAEFVDPSAPAEPDPEPMADVPEPEFEVADHIGEIHAFADGHAAVAAYERLVNEAEAARGSAGLQAIWDNNHHFRELCRGKGWEPLVQAMSRDHAMRLVTAEQREKAVRDRQIEERAMEPDGDIAAEEAAGQATAAPEANAAPEPPPIQRERPAGSAAPQVASPPAAPRRRPAVARNLIWRERSLTVRPWAMRSGETDWRRYHVTLTELISEAVSDAELSKLWADNDEHLKRMHGEARAMYDALLATASNRQNALAELNRGQEGEKK